MPQPSRLSALLSELKRRRVFRVAAVYGGVAFVLVQIIDGTFEVMGIPAWVSRLAIILLTLGFPLAVGLAWVFDITPEGIVRTDRPKTGQGKMGSAQSSSRRHWRGEGKPLTSNRAMAMIAVLAIAFGVWGRWGETRLTARLRSDAIAVMYFENLTGDPAYNWLESGVVQMLTANLGHMEGLEVISSQRLSDILRQVAGGQARQVDRATATQVALQAGAGSMLLGSVMGSGERFRLNAELVNVETGQLLGTEAIDTGPGGTIFALVDTLSQRLAARLGAGGNGESGVVSVTATLTASLAALRLYVDGVEALNRLQYRRAAELLDAAVGVDSSFAMAYYQLFIAQSWAGKADLSEQALEQAGRHSQRLTPRERRLIEAELQPTLKTKKEAYEALVADYPDEKLAWYRYGELLAHAYWPRASGAAFRRAVDLDPDFTVAYSHLIDWYATRGEYETAQQYIDHLLALDSTSISPYSNQAFLEWQAGRREQERTALEKLLRVAGKDTLNTTVYLAKIILAQEDWDFQRAVELAAATRQHIFFEIATGHHAGFSMARGQMVQAREVAAENNPRRRSRLLAMGALYTGDLATAHELLDQRLVEVEQAGPVNEALAVVRFQQFLVQHAGGDEAGMRRSLRELRRLTKGTQSRLSVAVTIAEATLLCWEGDPAAAVARFESALPESRAVLFTNLEILVVEGLTSCLAENQQWSAVLDHLQPERLSGSYIPSSHMLLLVRLPLRRARALAATGRQYEALEAYQELLDQLRDADEDFPYVIAARNEYQRLRGQVVN